jgi:hypothetical protein
MFYIIKKKKYVDRKCRSGLNGPLDVLLFREKSLKENKTKKYV